MKQTSYCLLVTSFFILCQDRNHGVFTCVSQSWAASWQGSRHLLDVFSVSDKGLWPLSQTGEENHPFALLRHCVMLLIPVGLQAFIVWWADRWKRNNYGIRLYWQMEVTHSEKSVHELEFRMSNERAFFQTCALLRFCCVSAVSLQEGDEWFEDCLWWLSSPAETSSHFHFCWFFLPIF